MPHEITWTHDTYASITGEIRCTEPEGAACRLTCPEDCPEWATDHEHGLVDSGACLAVEAFEAGGVQDSADDEVLDHPVQLGLVLVRWHAGIGWGWRYAS